MGCQIVMKPRAVNAGLQPRCEEMLVETLERAGCTPESIYLDEPRWTLFSPDPDFGATWTPYWAWELDAYGEKP